MLQIYLTLPLKLLSQLTRPCVDYDASLIQTDSSLRVKQLFDIIDIGSIRGNRFRSTYLHKKNQTPNQTNKSRQMKTKVISIAVQDYQFNYK
ncbi:CLUMA_CG014044, isoform A [Clunio marinus]|uniref:CLUMA_CG014044, isoform A n=1 Tax=Clunio marinus TaxID=568069 RepID=A0A1J1IKU0_9DIPT|nr:CLUMA_CG014044, isoform A [Clunio marinus]